MVFVIRRILQSVVVVLVMSLVVFVGVHLVGDPVHILISDDMTQAEIDAFIQRLGLDRPVHEQYFHFLANAARGDLGNSFVFGEPALKLILQRMPATLELAFAAFILAIVFGIPLGMYAGLKPDSPASRAIMAGSILGFSLPTFWVGLMLIMVFAVMLGWLPSTGRGDFMTWDGLRHLALPAFNLALFKMALVTRLARAGTREAALQDYVKFARAKGLSPARVVLVHVLKNILIPVVTVLGLELGGLIAFSVVTETVFAWPGMGKLLIDSIQRLDRPVIVAYLVITVLMFVVINMALVIRLARAGTREAAQATSSSRAQGALVLARVVLVHVLKNILIPVVTVLGLELGGLIAFSVVTETIFAWPGMGKLLIDSIQRLDRPVIVAYLVIIGADVRRHQSRSRLALFGLDPRVRLGRQTDGA